MQCYLSRVILCPEVKDNCHILYVHIYIFCVGASSEDFAYGPMNYEKFLNINPNLLTPF